MLNVRPQGLRSPLMRAKEPRSQAVHEMRGFLSGPGRRFAPDDISATVRQLSGRFRLLTQSAIRALSGSVWKNPASNNPQRSD
jgi:hypothetical protein